MKVIHCADLHLDSKMDSFLTKEKAEERREELLATFSKMLTFAEESQVEIILIAGDLFDGDYVATDVKRRVFYEIAQHKDIRFYYLKGNHDRDFGLWKEGIPENLRLFSTEWNTYYEGEGRLAISGLELTKENQRSAGETCPVVEDGISVVMLHGQVVSSFHEGEEEQICLKEFQNRKIRYLALGHVHKYMEGTLDAKGTYCYPGCLEGRGFDECGPHGFVLLDFDLENQTFSREFIPFAGRRLELLELDVTPYEGVLDLVEQLKRELEQREISTKNLLKIRLFGEWRGEEISQGYIQQVFFSYYYVRVENQTTHPFSYADYEKEESLFGEFVRKVLEDETLTLEEQEEVIRIGRSALLGEEAELETHYMSY